MWVGKLMGGLHKVILDDLWSGKATDEKVQGVTNWVATIYQDSHGAIWTAGRYRSDPISRIQGTEVQYFSAGDHRRRAAVRLRPVFPGRAGRMLYIGTRAGLARYDGKQFCSLQGTADRPVPRETSVCHSSRFDDVLWFASDSGLYRYDGSPGRRWTRRTDCPAPIVKHSHRRTAQGDYWIGTDKGLDALPTHAAKDRRHPSWS